MRAGPGTPLFVNHWFSQHCDPSLLVPWIRRPPRIVGGTGVSDPSYRLILPLAPVRVFRPPTILDRGK